MKIHESYFMSDLTTRKIIEEIESLPIEARVQVAESVLKSLNPTDSKIDDKWIEVAERRLEEMISSEVKSIPGDEVFKKIQEKFAK